MRCFSIVVLLWFSTLMTGCNPEFGKDAGALNETLSKDEIIGCYRSSSVPLAIRVEADRIIVGGKVVYSSYDYGHGGRGSDPLLVVRPRMQLQRNESGSYSFTPWKQDLGRSFSYPVDRQNAVSIRIISSDAIEHRFTKVACS